MRIAAALCWVALVGCRDAPASRAAPPEAAAVPKLPASPDGLAELRALDQRIEIHRDDPGLEILLLLDRAWIRGRLEDHVAAVRRSEDWVAKAPALRRAWLTRAQVLTRV